MNQNYLFCKRIRYSTTLLCSALLLLGFTLWGEFTGLALAQTFTVSDINPDRSTLDSSDPDGASGGRVNGVAVASNGTTLYAASEWGGLFKSTDSGRIWQRVDSHLPLVMWDVAVDPTDANQIYATSFYDGRVNSLAGINVSSDGGNTWSHPVTATPPVGFCFEEVRRQEPSAFGISIDPDNPQNIYVGTNCGLAISADRGVTWRYVDPTPTDRADNVWDVVVHDNGIIDLIGDDEHQRSTDGGNQWSTATGSLLPSGRGSLAVSPDEPYVLFAVMGERIYESDDGGASWPSELVNRSPQGRIPFVVTNQRAGNSFDLWFGDVELYRASCTTPASPAPGGVARCPINNWAGPFTRSAGAHDDAGKLIFNPTTTDDACPLLFSSDGGVYYNTRTSSPTCHNPRWEQPDVTPHALWLFGMGGVDQPGDIDEDLYFANQDTGTFATTNAGAAKPTWNNRNCCDGFDIAASSTHVLYSNCCFRPAPANRLFLRNRGMSGGREINTYPAGDVPGFRAPDVIDLFGADDYVVVTTSGVFITNDITATPIQWLGLGTATAPVSLQSVKATVSNGTPTFFVQSGVADGRSQDRLWRYDGTVTNAVWRRVNPPGGSGGFGIFDVDANNPDRLFASHLRTGSDPQMILSNNGGITWTVLSNLDTLMTGGGVFKYQNQRGPTNSTGLNGYPQPTLVAFDPNDSAILVAGGADSGLFISTDSGVNWTLITDPVNGLPHLPRPHFAYFDHEPVLPGAAEIINIYIGTQGRGVWRVTLSLPEVVTVDGNQLHNASFEQDPVSSVTQWSVQERDTDLSTSWSSEMVRTGTHALFLSATRPGNRGWPGWFTTDTIPLAADQEYSFSVWAYSPNGAGAWISLDLLDENDHFFLGYSSGCPQTASAGQWYEIKLSLSTREVPNAKKVRLGLQQCLTFTEGQVKTLYYDDVFFGVKPNE